MYIGRDVDNISNVEKLDNITFDGGTTYALEKSSVAYTPSGANNILISIDGVVQMGNFSTSTSNIVFDWSPTSSNTCDWIMHYGTGLITTPADSSVTASKLGSLAVTGAKLNTDVISAQTELASAPADADEFMVSDGGVLKRIDYSLIKAANTPAFEAYLNSDQTLSDSTAAKVACNIEKFDTDGCYDKDTNYRFTPTTAGKYYCYGTADIANDNDTELKLLRLYLVRNGSYIEFTDFNVDTSFIKEATISVFSVVDFNGSSDYLELKVDVAVDNNVNNLRLESDGDFGLTKFGAFKLIGVS